MSRQRRIQKRDSLDSRRRLPVTNPLKTRNFSSGLSARESRLPETNILQPRPFAPRVQKVKESEPPSPEQIEAATHFGFNGGSIPAFAHSTAVPPTQAKSTVDGVEDEYLEDADEATSEVEGKDSTDGESGTIQRVCSECEAELEEKEPLQAKLTVGEPGDKYEPQTESVVDTLVQGKDATPFSGEYPDNEQEPSDPTDNLLATRRTPPTRPPASFKYTTINPLKDLGCGGFDWKIQWQVENQMQDELGFVVQKVEYHLQQTPCYQRFPNRPKTQTYWEAWPAINDDVYNDLGLNHPHRSDTFGVKPAPDHYGINAVQGNAKFIPGYKAPIQWNASVQQAVDLLATYSEPSGWSDEGTIVRHVANDFNCCPKKLQPGSNNISEISGGVGALSDEDKKNIKRGGSHQPFQIGIPIPGIPAPVPVTPIPVP